MFYQSRDLESLIQMKPYVVVEDINESNYTFLEELTLTWPFYFAMYYKEYM